MLLPSRLRDKFSDMADVANGAITSLTSHDQLLQGYEKRGWRNCVRPDCHYDELRGACVQKLFTLHNQCVLGVHSIQNLELGFRHECG